MHEWGLTEQVVKEILNQAKASELIKINKVILTLGDDKHLTPESLKFCFETISKKEILLINVELEINKGEGKGIVIDTIEGEKNE